MIIGGAQENTFLTCRGLQQRGWEVYLLSGPQTGPEGSLHEMARAERFGFEIIAPLVREISPPKDLAALRAIRRWLERHRPDIVHTHSSKAGILGRIAARQAGVPIIVHTIHGMSFNRTQRLPIRWAFRCAEAYCARFTDRLIAVADAMIEQTVRAGVADRSRCITIYSGMEVEKFDPSLYDAQAVRRQLGIPPDAVVVVTVARMFRNKGYEQLIPAMGLAVRQEPNLHFLWVGDGPFRDEYLEQARLLGVAERVHLTGLVRPEEVPKYLAAADILAHASQWEGLPRVVVQGLLMGKPAVAFAVDGTPEVVLDGQTGLLVPLNDVQALADGIVRLGRDASLRERLGAAGRQLCLERFDWRVMVQRIEQVYLELAAAKGLAGAIRQAG